MLLTTRLRFMRNAAKDRRWKMLRRIAYTTFLAWMWPVCRQCGGWKGFIPYYACYQCQWHNMQAAFAEADQYLEAHDRGKE